MRRETPARTLRDPAVQQFLIARAAQQPPRIRLTPISCHLLEVHASEHPEAVVVLFRQGKRADRGNRWVRYLKLSNTHHES
jgi:hypothetical protein